ncbi:phytoene dehydrogenase-like protein [Kibdelosporangium banguiense]|uniref:Pyridine nucleotide-disulfide oxidoreductase domain-containing protein 2 n=1 Tax=Kibdelosporangium banguiense TaxID=1365924 RepID=A0ABS4TV67_9PSEU|nr:NAD(P)/FAD-dependent oxidoreductase [Kibdelosporangium banguiense]MBP2327879.1 phytoene dehydrogenase-like protein [Kibdelosporangium banguiense]
MNEQVDAVVIGSGINGMVAAAELAKAGWSVALVERNDTFGGFIATEERTLPGYRHDTYSSWHPLFVSGPAYAALGDDLHRLGLEYRNTDEWVTASVADDGRVTAAHRDPERTAALFADGRDRDTYLAALNGFLGIAEPFGTLLGSELLSGSTVRTGLKLARTAGRSHLARLLRDTVTSGRSYCRREFRGNEVDHLWSPWLLHAGLSPDHASGGLMIPILAATMHGFGLPVVAGGSARLVETFGKLFAELGVSAYTGTEVEHILVEDGRAVGVVAAGRHIRARRAVVASCTPTALVQNLLPAGATSTRFTDEAERFRYGRGAMQIHVALAEPPAWQQTSLSQVPLIHLSDGSASTGIACAQAEAGLLPAKPTVVVGQQYVLDPTRVPDGAAALWLQLQEVPFAPTGDAAGELDTANGWTRELADAFAQRVIDRVAAHVPGLAKNIRAIDVITPADLAAHNVNAVHGDPYGGSAELDQNFLWRPTPTGARHSTPVPGLWHIGASTHPGPGLGGASGHLVAQRLLRRKA